MKQALAELESISELLSEDSEAALRSMEAFRAKNSAAKNKFVTSKADLLTLIIASVFNRFEQQQIDDAALLKYFEREHRYDEAAQLLLSKARHYFMNGKLTEGEALLHYIRDNFFDKISLRSEIVYMTRVAFIHGRRQQYDDMVKVSMQALDKLGTIEVKNIWYYSIYTIFCTNIAECYHSNADFEKAWPYLQQSIEIADKQNIPVYNKFNVYSYVGFHYEYKAEYLKAADWFEKVIYMLESKPAHEYYEIQSRLAVARQYAQYARPLPQHDARRMQYIDKQHQQLTNVSARTKREDGNYLPLLSHMAELEYQRGNNEAAAQSIDEALEIYTARQHTKGIIDCHRLAHEIYYAWGKETNDINKVVNAYEHLKNASDMIAAQARQSNLQKIEAIETKHQLQQKHLNEMLMQQQIEGMNKEMRLNAINLQEKITLLDELKLYVDSLKKKKVEKAEFVNAVSNKIGMVKVTEQDKALMQQKIDDGNTGLFQVLAAMYPTLTPNEVRGCALIKTGMTNKELSKLYGIGERGYEQLRHRIKKKMNLKRGDNLVKHLMELNSRIAN